LNPRLEFPELGEHKLDMVLARLVETFGEFEYAEDLEVEKLLDDHLAAVAGVTSPWFSRRKSILPSSPVQQPRSCRATVGTVRASGQETASTSCYPPAEARTANRQLRDDLLARVDMESVRRCRHEIDVDDDDLPMTGFTQCRHISSPAAVRIAVVNARPQIARCAPWRVVRNRSGMDSEAERRDRPTSVVTSSLNFCAHVLEATKHVSHTDNGRA
jgi:hypothetical protein